MQSSLAVRLPASRVAQLKVIANARTARAKSARDRAVAMTEVLETMIQREWEREFRNCPPPDFRIKAGRSTEGLACVLVGHDVLGDLLMTSEHAMALGRGARRVANGDQDACLIIENHFTRKGVLVNLRPHGRGFVLSFGKREPLGLTRTMTLDLSKWLIAAAQQAEAKD